MAEKRKDDPLAFTEHCRDARALVLQMKSSETGAREEALKKHLKGCPVCQKVLSTYFSAVLQDGETPAPSKTPQEVFVTASSGSGNQLPEQAVTVQVDRRGVVEILSATGEVKHPVKRDDPTAESSVVIGDGEGDKRLPFAVEIRFFSTADELSFRVRQARSAEAYSVVLKPVLKDGRTDERIMDARRLGQSAILFLKIPEGRYRMTFLGDQILNLELAVKQAF